MKHCLEVLAPAGDMDMLRAAVFSGADSVYLGVKGFNARRGAQNFDASALLEATAFCHARNCRVYAAVNTLVLPGREKDLYGVMQAVARAGCDAVIVQDLATLQAAKEMGLTVHASTQMSVHSKAGVQMLHELGFSRAILARELQEDELRDIAQHSPIELEIFVHGALCVSVSGQCYASAFLGGRSANRGACAGTCRLPFEVCGGACKPGMAAQQHHLSLKDLSILDALPRLEEMGIASAKIEGRLRGPEYVAVVVDSAQKALNKEEYDRKLLQDVFSRSGFTAGWFGGVKGAQMFGVRTEADTHAGKKAQPKARELYRRERPRVAVQFALQLAENGGTLTVRDNTYEVYLPVAGPLAPAEKDPAEMLRAALAKTGGTPFFVQQPGDIQVETHGFYLAAGQLSALRRQALEKLLQKRSAPPVQAEPPCPKSTPEVQLRPLQKEQAVLAAALQRPKAGSPLLCARFEHVAHVPASAFEQCTLLVLPLAEAERVPDEWRSKTVLWLPRVLFGKAEEQAARQIEKMRNAGFAGYEVNNLAHIALCRGLPMRAGFGMNIANAQAARRLMQTGCAQLTLSPELSLAQMRTLVAGLPAAPGRAALDMLCYGYLPLFLTRACPLANKPGLHCGACSKSGTLADRKGKQFPVLCRDGVRSVYNPVPLWMADRLAELPTDTATLYFVQETAEEAERVLQAFSCAAKAPGAFTRGLYDSGTTEEN